MNNCDLNQLLEVALIYKYETVVLDSSMTK
jgi:hypothetical protein